MDEPTTDLDAREAQFAKRSLVLAFFCGLLLASLISAGVIGERLQAGSVRTALLVDLVVLVAGIFTTVLTARPLNVRFEELSRDGRVPTVTRLRPSVIMALQIVGIACGIGLVHLMLKQSHASALSWMCECPPQFVNDAVATLGTLAAVWACASRRLRMDLLIGTLGILLLYGFTRHHWHVDRAPFSFELTIQELVVAQVIATATGLLAFRRFSSA
jgi:hypothetical protein